MLAVLRSVRVAVHSARAYTQQNIGQRAGMSGRSLWVHAKRQYDLAGIVAY